MTLLIPEHMTVQGKNPNTTYISITTIVTLWGHMVVKTISAGAYPEIEPKWLIMALLNPEYVTVQEK